MKSKNIQMMCGVFIVLVTVSVITAASVDWDLKKIPDSPIWEKFGLTAGSELDLAELRATLVENRNGLYAQKESQKSLASDAAEKEAGLVLLKESLCRSLQDAEEKRIFGIDFAGYALSIPEGREQLGKVVKTIQVLAEEKTFRTEVIGKIDERIDEIGSDIVRIDKALSIRDVADLFEKIDESKGRYEPVVEASRLGVLAPPRDKSGPLTEEELISLVGRLQATSKSGGDVDGVLEGQRPKRPRQGEKGAATASSPPVVSEGPSKDGPTENWETLILVRPPKNGGKVADRVK